MVFPQTYEQYRYLLEENQVLYVEARLSIREDEETKLVCRMAAPPQQVLEPKTKEGSQQPTEQLPQERKTDAVSGKAGGCAPQEGQTPGTVPSCALPAEPGIYKVTAVSGDFLKGGAAGLLLLFWIHRSWSAHRSGCGLPSINRFTVSWSESSGPRMWSWWSRNGSGCAFYG